MSQLGLCIHPICLEKATREKIRHNAHCCREKILAWQERAKASFSARRRLLHFASKLRASLLVAKHQFASSVTGRRARVYFAPLPALWLSTRLSRLFVQPV
jgi:hypothetical protein